MINRRTMLKASVGLAAATCLPQVKARANWPFPPTVARPQDLRIYNRKLNTEEILLAEDRIDDWRLFNLNLDRDLDLSKYLNGRRRWAFASCIEPPHIYISDGNWHFCDNDNYEDVLRFVFICEEEIQYKNFNEKLYGSGWNSVGAELEFRIYGCFWRALGNSSDGACKEHLKVSRLRLDILDDNLQSDI